MTTTAAGAATTVGATAAATTTGVGRGAPGRAAVTTKLEFLAPGPGCWEAERTHFGKPAFGPLAEVFTPSFVAGMRACMHKYGMLLDTIDVRFVHGFPYMQPRVVGAPVGGGKPPPPFIFKLVFKALTTLHPELRRRIASQRDLFQRRPWREAVRIWDESLKEETVARHTAIDVVDVRALDDAALAQHLLRTRDHGIATLTQDHGMNLDVMLPTGDLLVHVAAWTGAAPAVVLHALKGTSAVSAGDSVERRALVAALRADDVARALLESGRPSLEIYNELTARAGPVGAAMKVLRVVWGNAILHGIDPATPTVNDEPGALLEAVRKCVRGEAVRATGDDAAAALRARVPEQHRPMFDVLLDDARCTYRLRDERHLYGALPCIGLARRTFLEAGRRLAARGALDDERLVFVATSDELVAMLVDDDRAVVPRLVERQHLTDTLRIDDAPAFLGSPPEPPPPPEWLPHEGARRAMRALNAFMSGMDDDADAATATTAVQGLAVSAGVHEGTARVCRTSADVDRVRQGDVLVATFTTPAINVVLPILGAIVTDRGGALSHAAIVCREYGIPGVVGTKTATTLIADGARVRVDGDRGIVTLL